MPSTLKFSLTLTPSRFSPTTDAHFESGRIISLLSLSLESVASHTSDDKHGGAEETHCQQMRHLLHADEATPTQVGNHFLHHFHHHL